jgi:hypothetical protein
MNDNQNQHQYARPNMDKIPEYIELNKRNKQNNYDDYFGEKLDRNKNPINKRKLF